MCGKLTPVRRVAQQLSAVLVLVFAPWASAQPSELVSSSHWQQVVRDAPLWESQGMQANLATIRRWVLAGEGFCSELDRHILFDRRMQFIGYLSDVGLRQANQTEINAQRERLAHAGKVDVWVPGDANRIGYPFVLSCHQPDAQLQDLVAGYAGDDPSTRLWGTWDGMRIATPRAPISLHSAIRQVYHYRHDMGRIDLPAELLVLLAGKVIIESGGVREARSVVGAKGIMQLSAEVLRDCRIGERFHLHRLAQIDCALYLLQQNSRNLQPVVERRFRDLPKVKRDRLFQILSVQAYHSGIGRVIALLDDEALNAPARYFAAQHERFTADDIALGMVFHNLGREQLGFASLYYTTDVFIAAEAACRRVKDLPGCEDITF